MAFEKRTRFLLKIVNEKNFKHKHKNSVSSANRKEFQNKEKS